VEDLANHRLVGVRQTIPATWSWSRITSFFGQPVNLVFLAVAGIIGFLGLYPSFFLLYGSFTDTPLGVPGHFTLANYLQAYADPQTYQLVLTSFIFALGASALSVILALILAWIAIRKQKPTCLS
jgi:ABC-type Fe3+ transport system permease subunit